jgi:hypothetical protein
MKKRTMLGIIVAGALLTAAPFSLHWSHENNVALSLDRADARVGRPLTPASVAGVHRRAYRRAVYGAAAAGAYGYPAYGYGGYYRPGYRAARGVAVHRALRH